MRMSKGTLLAVALAVLAMCDAGHAWATTRTVGSSGADFTTIQAAIDASKNRDTILVAPGIYVEDINFNGKTLTLRSTGGAPVTTIKGSSYAIRTVSGETSETVIQGFTITSNSYGIYASASDPRILECVISSGSGNYGVYATNAADVLFQDTSFQNNHMSYTLYADKNSRITIEGSSFSNNVSRHGGGIYLTSGATATITNTTFTNNQASSGYGGAIYTSGAGELKLEGCTFSRNQGSHGGALWIETSTYRTIVRNCEFYANSATYGGAIYANGPKQVYLADNLFVENVASTQGGAFYLASGTYMAMINNTIVGSDAPTGGGLYLYGSTGVLLLQNIIVGSTNGHGVYAYNSSARVLAWYNDVYDNFKGDWGNMDDPTGLRGNISADPGFVAYENDDDFTNDDFTLASDSPLIDAGSPTFLDADGSPSDIGRGGGDDTAFETDADHIVSPLKDDAFRTINDAVAESRNGEVLQVYPGLYYGDISFSGKGVTIASAFGPETVLIVGTSYGVYYSSSETEQSVLDGVSITSLSTYGMYGNQVSPTIRNCHIRYCSSSHGVYFTKSQPVFTNVRWEDNSVSYNAYFDSGSSPTFNGCMFVGNRSNHGGAIYISSNTSATVRGSVFEDNTAASSSYQGGAIYMNGSWLEVYDSRFTGNWAGYGGAIAVDTGGGRVLVRDSRFEGNSSTYGGAMYLNGPEQGHFIDNIFVENEASTTGGAIYLNQYARTAFLNNTFVGNAAPTGGHIYAHSGSNTLLFQNILAFTEMGEALNRNSTSARIVAWYNDFYDNYHGNFGNAAEDVIGVRGNIEADPMFTDYSYDGDFSNDDFTLQEGSPCIDAGSTTFVDADGSPSDLGAGGGDDDRMLTGADLVVSPLDGADYHSLQEAIDAASTRQTLHVYPGVYYGDIDYGGKDLHILGVFGPEATMLVGTSYGPSWKNTETSEAILEGMTVLITGSYGLYVNGASPTIKRCHFRYGSSSYAAYHHGGSPTYIGVRFEDNHTSYGTYFDSGSAANITGSVWENNSASHGGGIYFYGAGESVVDGCTFNNNQATSGYGGGIYAYSTRIFLSNSTFTGNSASHGGGLFVEPGSYNATVKDTVFFDNEATYGGGVFVNSGQAYFADVAIVENLGNQGGGVYINSNGRSAFVNCNVIGNTGSLGGGFYIYSGSNTLIANSIIAYSLDGTGIHTTATSARVLVTYTDVFDNADGGYSGSITDQSARNGNLSVDPNFVAYSRDGNLANDDFTLKSTSLLIDHGVPTFPDEDGSPSDIGVGGGDDDARVDGYDTYVSPFRGSPHYNIVDAVAGASQGDRIAIYPGVYYGDVDPNSLTVHLTGVYGNALTVMAASSSGLYLDQGEGSASAPMTVTGLTITSNGSYAVYVSNGHLSLVDSAIRYCMSSHAIYVTGATVDLTRTIVEENPTSYPVYYTSGAQGTITASTFRNNSGRHGGAIYLVSGADLSVADSWFTSNQATSGYGGAIYSSGSTLQVADTVFYDNLGTHGGAVYHDSGSVLTMNGCLLVDNAATYGGAYFAGNGQASLSNNIFQGNTATSHGGAMYVNSGETDHIINNNFIENHSGGKGGGVYAYGSAVIQFVNNIVAWQQNGEGLYVESGVTEDVRHDNFYENFDGDTAGPGMSPLDISNKFVDPEFVYYTQNGDPFDDDQHLAEGSPMIDAGDPYILDSDGSPSDIGAFGGSGGPMLDRDGDGYTDLNGDCDDSDANTYPGAIEIRDGEDNDCNGVVDDPFSDKDGDGFDPTSGDCDDTDPYINPDMVERCDGIDQDCDGEVDEGAMNVYYLDNDGDGYGSASYQVEACSQPTGYASNDADCDDTDASVKPSAAEVCDGLDNNCNGEVDEGLASSWYVDADEDGYGDSQLTQQGCTQPEGTSEVGGDCDETDPAVNPGATEVCNGKDDDCDGVVDEGAATVYYADADGDGYGDPDRTRLDCDTPDGYVETAGDCNDSVSDIHPGADETCDGLDNDCDGATDEGLANTYYQDADQDGYGNNSVTQVACSAPTGYTERPNDCDDTRADINPEGTEVCDDLDNDCDGVVDENLAQTYYKDVDSDGYGDPNSAQSACEQPTGYVTDNTDCDDLTAEVHPGVTESCNDRDDDCDGSIDEGLEMVTYYLDDDGDGFGLTDATETTCSGLPSGYSETPGDCDDTRTAVNPDAEEVCDGRDNDCDGATDEGFDMDGDGSLTCSVDGLAPDCDDSDREVYPGAIEYCDGKDNDCDGAVDETVDEDGDGVTGCDDPPDCDDTNASVFPGATEVCDGLDNDCDGETDEGFDMDGDGFFSCALDDTPADCDDGNPDNFPGAPESCDGVDNDCDGEIDEDVQRTYCLDADGDGYGDPDTATLACSPPEGMTLNCTDIDDEHASVFPGAPEAPDGLDNDGDGIVDEGTEYFDDDGDGYNDLEGDCDDGNANVHPDAVEIDDGVDNDCDGEIDEEVDENDNDGDGYSEAQGDCDDTNPDAHPDALETADGVDNDCDGHIDEGTEAADDDLDGYSEADGDCNDANPYVHPDAPEFNDGLDNDCDGEIDEDVDDSDDDGDGYSEADGDPDDTNPNTYPGAEEIPDGLDNDGDGEIDEGTTAGDDDGDGYSEDRGDCDDTNPYVHPGATEYPDNDVDDNCNGIVDETGDGALEPDAQLSETAIAFGEVYVGSMKNGSVTLENLGTDTLTVIDVTVDDTSGVFQVLSNGGILVPVGANYTLWFVFSPDAPGALSTTATVETDDPDSPSLTITLEGIGVEAPEVSETPQPTPGEVTPTPWVGDDDSAGDDDDTTPADEPPDETVSPTPAGGDEAEGCTCSGTPHSGMPLSTLFWTFSGLGWILWSRRRSRT